MHLELSEPLREYIDKRVRSGNYDDAHEYLRDLIRRDQEDQARKRLRDMIEEGLASGRAAELTRADRAAIRDRIASIGR